MITSNGSTSSTEGAATVPVDGSPMPEVTQMEAAQFRELMKKAFDKIDEIARADQTMFDDPEDRDTFYRLKWLRQESDSTWRAVQVSDAARIHDMLLENAVLAEDSWGAMPDDADRIEASRAAWNQIDLVRKLLGLNEFGPPAFIGPVPPDSTCALARMGVVDDCHFVQRRLPCS